MGTIAVAGDRHTEKFFTIPCHCSAERREGPRAERMDGWGDMDTGHGSGGGDRDTGVNQ